MKIIEIEKGHPHTHHFYCPGCKTAHGFSNKIWTYNNDPEKPTVRASILVRFHYKGKDMVCHSFITDGNIQFLSDCTHELAGLTVSLPEL
ncbi:DUF6527 family protein [Adhaeribacter aquaticus]|uniref:DUF6527 family protein n=1 Tax=Adhaeribacter aquaticus TaxID=299567 RepID=UPI000688A8ED|nr:DUF6527 family protein [Adhaeribacter aquaticus]